MDISVLYSIGIPLVITGVIFFLVFRYKKNEPLTYAEYFVKDKNPRYLHVLGSKRIMPDEGNSFDIYEHYVFDLDGLKLTKGQGQRGKNLDLRSEFVKRNLAYLGQKLGATLEFEKTKEDDSDDDQECFLKIYHFDDDQSDTEVYDDLENNNLTFIKRNAGDRERFTMILCRHGREVKRFEMKGDSEYFFKAIYVPLKSWICFLYRKQRNLYSSGMGLCILNYDTGEMVYDALIKPV